LKTRGEGAGVSPSELIEAGERLYGQQWRQPLAALLGVDVATLRRWTSAQIAVPKPVALALTLLLEKQNRERSGNG
jgi:hypothetical protein